MPRASSGSACAMLRTNVWDGIHAKKLPRMKNAAHSAVTGTDVSEPRC